MGSCASVPPSQFPLLRFLSEVPRAAESIRTKGHLTFASAVWKTPGACNWEQQEDTPMNAAAWVVPRVLGGVLAVGREEISSRWTGACP